MSAADRGRIWVLIMGALVLGFGFSAPASAETTAFSNPEPIAIYDAAARGEPKPAGPYPSSISVSGRCGAVQSATVTLRQLSHGSPPDIDALLVAPKGQGLILMSDAGGNYSEHGAVTDVTLTFDDSASSLPAAPQISSGTFRPTDYVSPDGFPDAFPSPAPSLYGSKLSVFKGADPNGAWGLYVVDDDINDVGRIADGWTLTLDTPACDADQDGVPDSRDSCPTEAGERPDGCPLDRDGDGLRDTLDRCPTEAGERPDGCPLDRDGDGLRDTLDRCPTVGGEGRDGCPQKIAGTFKGTRVKRLTGGRWMITRLKLTRYERGSYVEAWCSSRRGGCPSITHMQRRRLDRTAIAALRHYFVRKPFGRRVRFKIHIVKRWTVGIWHTWTSLVDQTGCLSSTTNRTIRCP